jgi:hypothetical protein
VVEEEKVRRWPRPGKPKNNEKMALRAAIRIKRKAMRKRQRRR